MKSTKRFIAGFFVALSTIVLPVYANESGLFEGNRFTMEFVIASSWNSDYSGSIAITDTGEQPIGDEVDDDFTIPEPGDMPFLRVTTPFPHGRTTFMYQTIEYIAVPSRGAYITEVYFTINDSTTRYIYTSGTLPEHREEQRGIFGGPAPFAFLPGENNIVFIAVDSAGLEATFTVDAVPVVDFNAIHLPTPPIDPQHTESFSGGATFYITNRLVLDLTREDEIVGAERLPGIMEIVDSYGFTIIGYRLTPLGTVTIEVPPASYEELGALGERIVNENRHMFRGYFIDGGGFVNQAAPVVGYVRVEENETDETETVNAMSNIVNTTFEAPVRDGDGGGWRIIPFAVGLLVIISGGLVLVIFRKRGKCLECN